MTQLLYSKLYQDHMRLLGLKLHVKVSNPIGAMIKNT